MKVSWFQKKIHEKKSALRNLYLLKNCATEKDKGCKITKPDKIGKEKIYLSEK